MRVNVYAEEMTDHLEVIAKEIDGQKFTGLRFYLQLPVTIGGGVNGTARGSHQSVEGPEVFAPVTGNPAQVRGPFMHHADDDDSSAVTFWGKQDLRRVLSRALCALDEHYGDGPPEAPAARVLELEEELEAASRGVRFARKVEDGLRNAMAAYFAALDAVRNTKAHAGTMGAEVHMPTLHDAENKLRGMATV